MHTRRYFPAVHLLMAFEAVARSGSITTAAEELALTQGAVSRQIMKLEEQIGVRLFDRNRKRLCLTKLGARYLQDVQGALDKIAYATVSLTTNPEGGVLKLAILPTFGTYWFAPKLPGFLATNPGVTINLTTHLESFDLRRHDYDAAIFFGSEAWEDTDCLKLMDEAVVPACSAEFLTLHRVAEPRDLLQAPLLHLSSRPHAWKNWLASHSIMEPPPLSMVFDQFATLAQAAKHGMGIALLPWFLIEGFLKSGELVSAYGPPVSIKGEYYLVWLKSRANYPPVQNLIRWVQSLPGVERQRDA